MSTDIVTRMRELNLTDAALAEKVKCERSMINRIRRGKARPSLGLAVRLSKALDLPAETFLPPERAA